MSQMACWTQALGSDILAQTVCMPVLPDIQAVRFVCQWERDPAVLWVGTGEELLELMQAQDSLSGLTFFASGDAPGLIPLAQQRRANLVASAMELTRLHEALSAVLRRYQGWELLLVKAAGRRHGLQGMMDAAAQLAEGALFLLDSGGRVACSGSCACLDISPARRLVQLGQLPEGMLPSAGADGPDGLAHCPVEGGSCWAKQIQGADGSTACMLLFTAPGWTRPDAAELLHLAHSAAEQVPAGERGSYWSRTDLKGLLTDLLSGKLAEDEEIDRQLSRLPRPAQRFCNFVIVEPAFRGARSAVPTFLLPQLEAVFPGSTGALHDTGAVLLVSCPDRDFQPSPPFDQERLQELLARYNLYAAVSNATSRRSMMRTTYLLTKSVMQLGQALRFSTKTRIFFFEDYAEYIAIDLCINSFVDLMGHDDIIYLAHPGMVKIYRYDAVHGTNLMDVVYYYCLNNCNVSQAAGAAYMHRNTFAARLGKLQELVQVDLSDGGIRQRMIFSYKILRYYDRYAKINLRQRLGVDTQPLDERKA